MSEFSQIVSTLVQIALVVGILFFAISQLSKGSGPAAKIATAVMAVLVVVYDKIAAMLGLGG